MILIDGSLYSGSGSMVRQAVAFSALTGQPLHLVNARAKREKPGLRRQHVRVIEAMCELVHGKARGVWEGSQEVVFYPGTHEGARHYCWDIESAGSATMVALAVLPVLAFRPIPTTVEIYGGLFQDFAPSLFHLQHVLLPLVHRMGLDAHIQMNRPGYVPGGKGSLSMKVGPLKQRLQAIILEEAGPIEKIWGMALASHLEERHVGQRMVESAMKQFAQAGYTADISVLNDNFAKQAGAALAIFADCAGRVRLGADGTGALGRRSEDIGRSVARQLLADVRTSATLDRFAADQIISFAAMARGTSRFLIPHLTDHVQTSAWLVQTFLGAETNFDEHNLCIAGIGWPL